MDEDTKKSLILRPGSELAVSKPKANQIVSRMTRDVLNRTRSHEVSRARFKLGDYEFREPDYRQILRWGKELGMAPEAVVRRLEAAVTQAGGSTLLYNEWGYKKGFSVEDGAIVSLAWDFNDLPLAPMNWEAGLVVRELSFVGDWWPATSDWTRFEVTSEEHLQAYVTNSTALRPDLPRLQKLQLRLLGLQSLDLSSAQQLTVLCCQGNPDVDYDAGVSTSFVPFSNFVLDKLDLTPVSKLVELYCDYNGIAELDLSPVPELETLWCGSNQLTQLDLSAVPKLLGLVCESNQLTELDLSAVPKLEGLSCSSNQLTELDLSAKPKLTVLYCDSNRLTELDLSGAPELKDLICEDNQLTELDLSPVPNLGNLTCDSGVRIKNAPRRLEVVGGTIVSYTDEGPDVVCNWPDDDDMSF